MGKCKPGWAEEEREVKRQETQHVLETSGKFQEANVKICRSYKMSTEKYWS